MAPLKVFAFDYATAGGPMTRSLPQSLRRLGDMLLQALQADLGALPGVKLTTMAAPADAVQAQQPFAERLEACVQAADAVWPLASESEGLLERLSRDVLRGKRILLGSAPGAVQVAASKLKLAGALAGAGVAVAATYSPHACLPDEHGAWVVKPDDGAGCLDTRLFSDRSAALAWIRAEAAEGYVLQPFIAGKLGSLSLLCCDGLVRVLSCNLERVAMRDNRFHFLGSTVNGLDDHDGSLDYLAQQVAAAIPSLWGYVGVDFVLTARGPVVLDVNPRLTAAYAGLHASIGRNPAGLVLDLLKGPAAGPVPLTARRAVSVDLGA
jgi:predicted ATP-grasp superfamily ATP-dependent carboligase